MNIYDLVNLTAPYTGLPRDRLEGFHDFVRQRVNVPGAVVQCGATNGGSAVLLWHASGGGDRDLWEFDSWEGLPEPTDKDGGRALCQWDYRVGVLGSWCKGDMEKAKEVARRGGVPKKQVHFIKGWFKDTLPNWHDRIGPIAMLHLDADWYQSTLECLTYLYPHLVSGGLLMLDDYGYWPGCDRACEEYGISKLLTVTPPSGAWMIKP